ncbi:hypothetical protein FOYG_14804 [Fusarium oxysporum NRRL 32931]|uniref:Uncharacterized protein n=1 Tax=Fusarium oxysporum NRRL 32931 TaxID=660029 RepID=W9HNY4_FUSOX|nr:hypothetical protein FOYG_14804 [Fusarium oxysporum NRRL 32931]
MSLTLENFFMLLYKALVISKGPPAKSGALELFVLPALTPEHSLHIQCTLQVHHAHSAPSHIPIILFFTFLAVWFCVSVILTVVLFRPFVDSVMAISGSVFHSMDSRGESSHMISLISAVDIMIGDTKEDVDIA